MNKPDKDMLAQIELELQQGQNSIEDIEILLKRKENIINFYNKDETLPKRSKHNATRTSTVVDK